MTTGEKPAGLTRARLGPIQQADLVNGLAMCVTGVGQAAADDLPKAWTSAAAPVTGGDWSLAFLPPSGWCVLLTQDCDVVRDDEAEPTVQVAPVSFVDGADHVKYQASRYHGRHFALPAGSVPGVPVGQEPLVDLAGRTSVLKVSLEHPALRFVRPLTEPQRRDIAEWLAYREGRASFPDDVVTSVLDPFEFVRAKLARSAFRKPVGSQTAAEQAVRAVTRWYAAQRGDQLVVLGVVTANSLLAAGFDESDITGAGADGRLELCRQKLNTEAAHRMERTAPASGFALQIVFYGLEHISAAVFSEFRLLVR